MPCEVTHDIVQDHTVYSIHKKIHTSHYNICSAHILLLVVLISLQHMLSTYIAIGGTNLVPCSKSAIVTL